MLFLLGNDLLVAEGFLAPNSSCSSKLSWRLLLLLLLCWCCCRVEKSNLPSSHTRREVPETQIANRTWQQQQQRPNVGLFVCAAVSCIHCRGESIFESQPKIRSNYGKKWNEMGGKHKMRKKGHGENQLHNLEDSHKFRHNCFIKSTAKQKHKNNKIGGTARVKLFRHRFDNLTMSVVETHSFALGEQIQRSQKSRLSARPHATFSIEYRF